MMIPQISTEIESMVLQNENNNSVNRYKQRTNNTQEWK